jgi:CubicO group peptidase (beta-lactamase class C family)
MQAEFTYNQFNGNVLIAKSGSIIYEKSFGYRNYDTKELLDNNSVFELASISKQFTAMGILLLKEKGLLNLSDTLRMYFPELPYHNITIKDMLTHTSGLPDYADETAMNRDYDKIIFNKDVIHLLATVKPPLRFNPGENWEYCNTAFALLASTIEKVSGLSYKDYMKANIFDPLGMRNTRVYNTRRSSNEVIPNYAFDVVYSDSLKKYILPENHPQYKEEVYFEGIQGDGAINSTTEDLLKWQQALNNHTLLSTEMQKEMLSHQSIEDTINHYYYGYGTEIRTNAVGDYYGHRGHWLAYWADLNYYPKEDLTLIVLSNNNSNTYRLTDVLAYLLSSKPIDIPYLHKAVEIDTTILGEYAGSYLIHDVPTDIKAELFVKNGKLCYRLISTREEYKKFQFLEMVLSPESQSKFFTENGTDIQFEFVMDKSGKIAEADFIFYSLKKKMIRQM